MSAWRSLRQPTVAILLLASVVHIVRGDLFDLVLFVGTAVLVLLDAGRADRTGSGADGTRGVPAPSGDAEAAPGRRHSLRWLIAAGLALFAALAALPSPGSLGAVLVLALIGLGALVLVLVRPPRAAAAQSPRSRLTGWPVWALIGVAACLWELASFVVQRVWPADEDAHPAVSDLVGPMLTGWFGRTVFLLLWAGAGWWLLRQWTTPAPQQPLDEQAQRAQDSSEANR